jgi:hypothetical protein
MTFLFPLLHHPSLIRQELQEERQLETFPPHHHPQLTQQGQQEEQHLPPVRQRYQNAPSSKDSREQHLAPMHQRDQTPELSGFLNATIPPFPFRRENRCHFLIGQLVRRSDGWD